MSVDGQVAHTLEVLCEWSEGFALSFVFSDTARCRGLPADVLYCASYAVTDHLVAAAMAWIEGAPRPVVLNFYGCSSDTIQAAMRRLNERRSVLEKFGRPMLVVCPAEARLSVQYAAPDLWHIRTLVPDQASEKGAR